MRQCPVCDYYLEPHDEECPRCKRNAEAAAKVMDSVQAPSNSAPLPSAFACYYHQHVPAIGQCSECLRNCCKSCLKNVNGLLLCPEDAKTAGKREEAAIDRMGWLYWYIIGAVLTAPLGWMFVHDFVLLSKEGVRVRNMVFAILMAFLNPITVGRGIASARELRKKISPVHSVQAKFTLIIALLVILLVIYLLGVGVVYVGALITD